MYIMLDHYDSFVYNLSSYLKDLGRERWCVQTALPLLPLRRGILWALSCRRDRGDRPRHCCP